MELRYIVLLYYIVYRLAHLRPIETLSRTRTSYTLLCSSLKIRIPDKADLYLTVNVKLCNAVGKYGFLLSFNILGDKEPQKHERLSLAQQIG